MFFFNCSSPIHRCTVVGNPEGGLRGSLGLCENYIWGLLGVARKSGEGSLFQVYCIFMIKIKEKVHTGGIFDLFF
jgi:hypothetical protein